MPTKSKGSDSRSDRKPTPPIRCGGCDTTWTGLATCHCSDCHETFAAIGGFDAHRVGDACVDPASIAWRKGSRKAGERKFRHDGKVWRSVAEGRPEHWAAAS